MFIVIGINKATRGDENIICLLPEPHNHKIDTAPIIKISVLNMVYNGNLLKEEEK